MVRPRSFCWLLIVCPLLASLILMACGSPATPTATPSAVASNAAATSPTQPTNLPAQSGATPTVVPPTAAPSPTRAPAVGGTMVVLHITDPDSLDSSVTPGGAFSYGLIDLLGATLVTSEPHEGKYVPYLAESWSISADALVWEFKLKKGVRFHDGSPLTAGDFVWTFERAMDPATVSQAAGPNLEQVDHAEAVDGTTLRLVMKQPYFPFLYNLTLATLQPLSRAAVDKYGDDYGRNPVGVGPYRFKEWQTGTRVVLERNPDYAWGPTFAHAGAAYIQTIEFRIIPESSTQVAGLESGNVDMGAVATKDTVRFKDATQYRIGRFYWKGIAPYLSMNVSKAPFSDIRVRQAFNLALDKELVVKVVLNGDGTVQYGPISPSVAGYWPGVEKIGYRFDLAKAKELMTQAGYAYGPDGMLQKDGKPFTLRLKTGQGESQVRGAQLAQQAYKALGVSVEIEQGDFGILLDEMRRGDYELAVLSMGYDEADLMYMMFHSSQIGAMNFSRVNDPELDRILISTRTLTDANQRQTAVEQAQKYIVENAFVVPICTPWTYTVLSARIKGAVWSETAGAFYLHDVYIEAK